MIIEREFHWVPNPARGGMDLKIVSSGMVVLRREVYLASELT